MKHKFIKKCLIVFLFSALIQFVFTQNQNHRSQQQNQFENEIEKQEFRLQQKFKNQQQKNLDRWIVQEMKHNEQYQDVLPYESVNFLLQSNVPLLYRMPVTLSQQMKIQVSIFSVSKQGLLVLPQSPSQSDFVQVSTFDETQGPQYIEGKVYIQRIIELRFRGKYKFIKFVNKGSHPIIVTLDIQQQELLLEIAVSDDKFSLTNKKMQTILKQTKQTETNREHLYKWQWGFYQKLWRHQSDMLGFTGAQLLVIVATSIVQMYCIKNLIDNELVI